MDLERKVSGRRVMVQRETKFRNQGEMKKWKIRGG